MPHLQVVLTPSTTSLPATISSALQGISRLGRCWAHKVHVVSQTPEITSLSSPKGCALFSLFSSHLFSFSIMFTGKGHQAQLQNAPNAFTEEWGCLKGSTYYGDCRVVSLRPDHDNHCFSIYRKVSDFLFPQCQPTGCYRCALEAKHCLEGLTEPFHF